MRSYICCETSGDAMCVSVSDVSVAISDVRVGVRSCRA
jgi:hypothetical protein